MRGVQLFMPGALEMKALSVEKNIPNSSPSHCLYLQGADGSLRGEKEQCRKPENPGCAWESQRTKGNEQDVVE